ncbi:MAG: MBL fold metallo-hydrolase, partial [Robinsoniella sp.]|nr:MBL fold metallo-hydrolase [Robinsoniella sp.]
MKSKFLKPTLISSLVICCMAPAFTSGAADAEATDLSVFESGEVSIDDKSMSYRLYDPSENGYDAESYPLVLFLHGEDGVGTDNEAQLTANEGATLWVDLADQNPAYVLAPQCQEEDWTGDDTIALVKQALDEVIAGNKVDTDRIYVQGMSMGGTGTWKMLLEYPDVFAAAIPICGQVPEEYYENPDAFKALANMPIWAFHTADDDVIPAEETAKAVQALKDAGSNCIKYEEYSAGSITPPHEIWNRVYEIGTPYNWLMIQSRARTNDNTLDPSMLFSKKVISDTITRVCDYELGQIYVIENEGGVLLIDTGMGGFGAADLYTYIHDEVLKNKDAEFDLILTHNHVDHVLGIPSLFNSGKLKHVYLHEADKDGLITWMDKMSVDLGDSVGFIEEGDVITVGDETLDVVEVPGHTPGSIVFFYNDY